MESNIKCSKINLPIVLVAMVTIVMVSKTYEIGINYVLILCVFLTLN